MRCFDPNPMRVRHDRERDRRRRYRWKHRGIDDMDLAGAMRPPEAIGLAWARVGGHWETAARMKTPPRLLHLQQRRERRRAKTERLTRQLSKHLRDLGTRLRIERFGEIEHILAAFAPEPSDDGAGMVRMQIALDQ